MKMTLAKSNASTGTSVTDGRNLFASVTLLMLLLDGMQV